MSTVRQLWEVSSQARVAALFCACDTRPPPAATQLPTHSFIDWELTPQQEEERSRLLELGGICPLMRVYYGSAGEIAAFLRTYALFWPRHLGFENLTVIFDDANPIDRLEAASIAASYPFVRIVFERDPDNIPVDTIFPKNPGYNRQMYSTLISDRHCRGAKYMAVFDSDSFLTTPVTLQSLLDATGRPSIRHVPAYKAGNEGARMLLGLKTEDSLGTFMHTFPVVYRTSTLALMRDMAVRKGGHASFEHGYSAVAKNSFVMQFNFPAWAAFYGGERDLYAWHPVPLPTQFASIPLPTLKLDEWAPRCAAGPRDGPVNIARHTYPKVTAWTQKNVADLFFSQDSDAASVAWEKVEWRPDTRDELEPTMMLLLSQCVLNTEAAPATCARALAHASAPYLMSLLQLVGDQSSNPATHLCHIAVHVCDVSRAPAATYGVSRGAAGLPAEGSVLFRALPVAVLQHFGVSSLAELCAPLERKAWTLDGQKFVQYEDEPAMPTA